MRNLAAALIVFTGGFIIMVIEIIGTRFLAKDFGSSFYVWVNQIGLVMVALAAGYYLGGMLADRWQRLTWLALLLAPAGVFTYLIPRFADPILNWIVMRHPAGEPVPALWVNLDPILGSALVFMLPCVVLAMLSPYMTQLATRSLARVGRSSGLMFAASTVGSIAGVFVSGYVLLLYLEVSMIFQATGMLTTALGLPCVCLNYLYIPGGESAKTDPRKS